MVLLHDTGNARPQKSDTYRSCMSESRTLVCVSYFARKSVLKETKPGIDVFLKPVFSSDGTRVLFSANGGTYYYPSDVYSIKIDGSSLQRLTRAKGFLPGQEPANGNAMYAEYFYSAQPASDGTKIL